MCRAVRVMHLDGNQAWPNLPLRRSGKPSLELMRFLTLGSGNQKNELPD
jgi:hypothetical protein